MKILILTLFIVFVSGCSQKHLKKNFKAKHELVDISNERSFAELTPKIKTQAKKLKKRGYRIIKKDDGYFAKKGKNELLLIEGYQCQEFK